MYFLSLFEKKLCAMRAIVPQLRIKFNAPPLRNSHGRGNVPVARNPIPKPHKRQNPAILTCLFSAPISHYPLLISHYPYPQIPQSNFHSSWGLAPEVPDVLKQASISRLTGCFRSLLKAPQIPSFRCRRLFYLKPSAFFVYLLNFSAFGII